MIRPHYCAIIRGNTALNKKKDPLSSTSIFRFRTSKGTAPKSAGWQQTAKGLPQTSTHGEKAHELRDPMARSLERLKWFLWHGNVYQALQVMQSAEMDLEAAVADTRESTAQKLLKAVYRASDADAGPRWTAHLRIPASASHVHGDELCEIG